MAVSLTQRPVPDVRGCEILLKLASSAYQITVNSYKNNSNFHLLVWMRDEVHGVRVS